MIIYKDNLITSDRHILHTNIAFYEYEFRKKFFPRNIEKDKLKNILDSDNENQKKYFNKTHNVNFLKYLINTLNKEVDNINNFIHLGDFIFNISKEKIKQLKNLGIEKFIFNFFEILKTKNINSEIIIGNHCESVLKNSELKNYYLNFFYKINYYKIDKKNKIIFTHYPIGFIPYENDEISSFFRKQNKLLEIYANDFKLNIHGHTHFRNFYTKYKDIKYMSARWNK